MVRVGKENIAEVIKTVDSNGCGKVYPLSVVGGFQQGDVFISGDSVLIWHYCGFAFIFGECGRNFLDEIYDTFLSSRSVRERRFVLFTESEQIRAYFAGKDGIVSEKRYFFEYKGQSAEAGRSLKEGFSLREIEENNIGLIQGRITPRFSWDNSADFLAKGKGFGVFDGETPAAWAFSAAVSGEEMDIGVETAENYRRMGLASAAVRKMIRYVQDLGKRPVWACHESNEGSRRLAESVGFVRTGECFTVKSVVL